MMNPIADLVYDLVPVEKEKVLKEEVLLLSRMYQSKNKIFDANKLLANIKESDLSSDVYFRKIALLTKQFLDNGYLDEDRLREYLIYLNKEKKVNSEKFKKILMILILNVELPQDIINLISNFNFSESDKSEKGNLQNLFLAERFSQNKDMFNSLEIFLRFSQIEILKS